MSLNRFIFGTEVLGGSDWGEVNLSSVYEAIDWCWDQGVRRFDTANVYGLGLSEQRLSDHLGVTRLKEAFIATKGGLHWTNSISGRAQITKDNSISKLRSSIEGSLERLGLNCLPLFFVHWPDQKTQIETIYKNLTLFKDEGLIASFGFSNFSIEDWKTLIPLIQNEKEGSVYAQLNFSRIVSSENREILKILKEHKVQVWAYGCLAQGLLSGKYNKESVFESNDRRHRLPHFLNFEKYRPILTELEIEAESKGLTMGQRAIEWVLEQPEISAAVIGCKNQEQAEKNLAVFLNKEMNK